MPFEAQGKPALPTAPVRGVLCDGRTSQWLGVYYNGIYLSRQIWDSRYWALVGTGLGSYGRRRQRIRRTARTSRKPMAARYSRFFLYWGKEKAPTSLPGRLAGVRRGKKRGTA